MNIKEIVDKIIKKSGVQANEYTVADRAEDVTAEYFKLIELATQIGSKFPISDGSDNFEEFTIVDGDQTLTRTITDVSIQKVEYRVDYDHDWACLERDTDRCKNCFAFNNGKFTANEKRVFLEDAYAGNIKVTYERASVTGFTEADYNAGTPPSPDWLPETYHPLLWMKPAINKSKKADDLEVEHEELMTLFRNHYGRDTENVLGSVVDEEYSPL